jgi:hypothetical protein
MIPVENDRRKKMNDSSAAEKALDEHLEETHIVVPQEQGEVGVKYLVSMCTSIARLSALIKPLRDKADSHPGIDVVFVHDLDVAAFSIAVDSALFFELGYRDHPVSSTVKAWTGVTMTAVAHLLSAFEEIPVFTTESVTENDFTDSIHSARQVLARLSDGLRFLCTWWIIAEALMLVVEARTSAGRRAEQVS